MRLLNANMKESREWSSYLVFLIDVTFLKSWEGLAEMTMVVDPKVGSSSSGHLNSGQTTDEQTCTEAFRWQASTLEKAGNGKERLEPPRCNRKLVILGLIANLPKHV